MVFSFAELLDRMITCIMVEEQAISATFPICVDKLEPHHKKSLWIYTNDKGSLISAFIVPYLDSVIRQNLKQVEYL